MAVTRKIVAALVVVGSLGILSGAVEGAITINVATGQNGTGTVQSAGGAVDAHWVINSQAAKVVSQSSADWWGSWAVNDAASAWVAKDPTTNNNGTGTYSYTFDLTGVNLSSVAMSGGWMLDDEGTLTLNGHVLGSQVHDGWNTGLHAFSVDNSGGFFNAGVNTVSLNITASDNFFEAVRMSGTVTGTLATPEPMSLGVLVIGGVVLLGRLRVRSRGR